MIAAPAARKLILSGSSLYESVAGSPLRLLGPLSLREGQRSERLTIIERIDGPLTVSTPSDDDRRLAEAVRPGLRILLVLEGLFQRSDHKNANGRIYPETLWDNIFSLDSEILVRVDNGEMLGECDHPQSGETALMRVACRVVKLWRDPADKRRIMGRMFILDTPGGRQIEAIHAGGGRIGVSSRGQGSVVRMGGADIVQSDYILDTWDAVHNPSTPGAYPKVMAPDELTERTERTEPKKMPPATATPSALRERFEKLRGYAPETMSADARALLRENVLELRAAIRASPATSDAIDLAPDVALFAERIEEVARKKTAESISDAPQIDGAKPAKQAEPAPAADVIAKESADEEEPMPALERAATASDACAILESRVTAILEATKDVRDLPTLTKAVRESYRVATKAVGPFTVAELDGVAMFVHKIREKVGSSRAGAASIAESASPSTKAPTMNAASLPALYEAQVTRTTAALAESARLKGQLSELSTKHAAALQIIEALTQRVRSYKKLAESSQREADAGARLVEALVADLEIEPVAAVQEALIATHPHVRGIADTVGRTRSISEAVAAVNRVVIESLPSIERESVAEDTRIRALRESRAAEERAERARLEKTRGGVQSRTGVATGLIEQTQRVTNALRRNGAGR